MKRSLSWRLVILFVLGVCLPYITSAQPGPPPDPDVPITGIEILIAAGALIGVKKLIGKSKQN